MKRTRSTGTREWALKNVNCFNGCTYQCRYCYAVQIAERFKRGTRATWGTMKPQVSVGRRKYRKYDGCVMFPSTHDIPDDPEIKAVCFAELDQLLAKGNRVLVVSKPNPKVIVELMERFAEYKEQIEFRFTITSLDPETLAFWEPYAPSAEDRLKALRLAYEAGWKTSVSMEPLLDYDPGPLIAAVDPYVSGDIWLGHMNHMHRMEFTEAEQPWVDEVKRINQPEHLQELVDTWKHHPKIRFKDSMPEPSE